MSGYDESKDEILDNIDIMNDNATGGYHVSLVRYNKGDVKISITSFFINRDGEAKPATGKRIKLSNFPDIIKAVQTMEARLKL